MNLYNLQFFLQTDKQNTKLNFHFQRLKNHNLEEQTVR